MPEISIIVPVYNTEKYLHRCIDSILAQTFTDFELILVDDGSPDNCPQICDEYAEKDCRVKVIHQENGGVSKARNVGIDNSCGTYLMFCDSDDYVDKRFCEVMHKCATEYPDDCIICNAWREDTYGNNRISIVEDMDLSSLYSVSMEYFELFNRAITGSACWRIFSTEKIFRAGLKFESGKKIGEDAVFCAQYSTLCNRHMFIPQPLYHYVLYNDSAVHSYHFDWLEQHLSPFYARIPLIKPEYMSEYCDNWLCFFIQGLDVVFDAQNTNMSFIEKMAYNHKILNRKEFRYCLENASCQKESFMIIWLLKTRNYYIYWLCKKIISIKHRF